MLYVRFSLDNWQTEASDKQARQAGRQAGGLGRLNKVLTACNIDFKCLGLLPLTFATFAFYTFTVAFFFVVTIPIQWVSELMVQRQTNIIFMFHIYLNNLIWSVSVPLNFLLPCSFLFFIFCFTLCHIYCYSFISCGLSFYNKKKKRQRNLARMQRMLLLFKISSPRVTFNTVMDFILFARSFTLAPAESIIKKKTH